MIYINGQQLDSIAALSVRFQSVLSMIQGGTEWLGWAIKDKTFPAVSMANEEELLKSIQLGLHADDYIRFNTFRASISKLSTLSDADIEQLAVIRRTLNDNEENLRVLLQRNQILSYADISEAISCSLSLAADRPDLFQAPSFSDILALATFVQRQKNIDDEMKNQASAFALKTAATISDFINLCYFFQNVVQYQLAPNLIPLTQSSGVQGIYGQLLPIATYLLHTPNAGTARSEKELRDVIPGLSRTNKFIGYLTVTASALNLVKNIQVGDQPDKNLQAQVDNYLTAVKNLVSFTPASSYMLSQDGRRATLRFEKGQDVAMVGINETGDVFILSDTKITVN